MDIRDPAKQHVVGGVDTHKDLHVAAVVDEHDRVLGSQSFATTRQGYRLMLHWMRPFVEVQRLGSNPPAVMAPACFALFRPWGSRFWRSRPRTDTIAVDAERTTISTRRMPPMPPLPASGPLRPEAATAWSNRFGSCQRAEKQLWQPGAWPSS